VVVAAILLFDAALQLTITRVRMGAHVVTARDLI
jgi:hypothetical protein